MNATDKVEIPVDSHLIKYLMEKIERLEAQNKYFKDRLFNKYSAALKPHTEIDYQPITMNTIQLPLAYEADMKYNQGEYHVMVKSYRHDGLNMAYYLSESLGVNHFIIANMHRQVIDAVIKHMQKNAGVKKG